MSVVSVVPGSFDVEEDFFTIEDLFQSNVLHQYFRKFLADNCQSICSLRLENRHGCSQMHVSLKTGSGFFRQIRLQVDHLNGTLEMFSATEVKLPDSISVMQMIMMFSCSNDYPLYTLELHDDSHLMLCCRKKVRSLPDADTFPDLLTSLASVADNLEQHGRNAHGVPL